MIAYAPFRAQTSRPFLSQAPVTAMPAAPLATEQQDILTKLMALQKDISGLIDTIPKGSVAAGQVAAIQKKLDACQALGPTAPAIDCLTAIKADLQGISEIKNPSAPVWPWIVGGLAAAGILGYFVLVD